MKWFFGFCLILLPFLSSAEPQGWMKQSNPNKLGMFIYVQEDCPFTLVQLENKIKGEYLRARITPTDNVALNITTYVMCLENKIEDEIYSYSIFFDIAFSSITKDGHSFVYDNPQYSMLMRGSSTSQKFFIDTLVGGIEKALTDYLEANFSDNSN